MEKKSKKILGGSVEIMVQWDFQNTVQHRVDSVSFFLSLVRRKCSMLPGISCGWCILNIHGTWTKDKHPSRY